MMATKKIILISGHRQIFANIFQLAPGSQSSADAGTSQNTSTPCYSLKCLVTTCCKEKLFLVIFSDCTCTIRQLQIQI